MIRISTNTMFRTGELAINARQRDLLAAQTGVSSGKRINTPSDDPLGAADISNLHSNLAELTQYGSNQTHARTVLNLADSALSQFTDATNDARDIVVQAGNGSFSDSERAQMATALEGVLGRLVGIANSSDGMGGYLFGGASEQTAPFTQTGDNVSYAGDSTGQKIEVAPNRFLPTKIPGDSVFQKVRAGNGVFTTAATASNTGAASIDVGSVTNPSALTGQPYSIQFTVAAGVTTYQVTNTATSTVAASGTYADPTSISFDGVQVTLQGAPANGDSFAVAPAGNQSIFDTLANAIATLRTPAQTSPAISAQLTTKLAGSLASINQSLDHVQLSRSQIGTGLNEVDAYDSLNQDHSLQYQTRLSSVESLDYATGVTALAQTQAAYTAALQSYSSISKLSLFNYL